MKRTLRLPALLIASSLTFAGLTTVPPTVAFAADLADAKAQDNKSAAEEAGKATSAAADAALEVANAGLLIAPSKEQTAEVVDAVEDLESVKTIVGAYKNQIPNLVASNDLVGLNRLKGNSEQQKTKAIASKTIIENAKTKVDQSVKVEQEATIKLVDAAVSFADGILAVAKTKEQTTEVKTAVKEITEVRTTILSWKITISSTTDITVLKKYKTDVEAQKTKIVRAKAVIDKAPVAASGDQKAIADARAAATVSVNAAITSADAAIAAGKGKEHIVEIKAAVASAKSAWELAVSLKGQIAGTSDLATLKQIKVRADEAKAKADAAKTTIDKSSSGDQKAIADARTAATVSVNAAIAAADAAIAVSKTKEQTEVVLKATKEATNVKIAVEALKGKIAGSNDLAALKQIKTDADAAKAKADAAKAVIDKAPTAGSGDQKAIADARKAATVSVDAAIVAADAAIAAGKGKENIVEIKGAITNAQAAWNLAITLKGKITVTTNLAELKKIKTDADAAKATADAAKTVIDKASVAGDAKVVKEAKDLALNAANAAIAAADVALSASQKANQNAETKAAIKEATDAKTTVQALKVQVSKTTDLAALKKIKTDADAAKAKADAAKLIIDKTIAQKAAIDAAEAAITVANSVITAAQGKEQTDAVKKAVKDAADAKASAGLLKVKVNSTVDLLVLKQIKADADVEKAKAEAAKAVVDKAAAVDSVKSAASAAKQVVAEVIKSADAAIAVAKGKEQTDAVKKAVKDAEAAKAAAAQLEISISTSEAKKEVAAINGFKTAADKELVKVKEARTLIDAAKNAPAGDLKAEQATATEAKLAAEALKKDIAAATSITVVAELKTKVNAEKTKADAAKAVIDKAADKKGASSNGSDTKAGSNNGTGNGSANGNVNGNSSGPKAETKAGSNNGTGAGNGAGNGSDTKGNDGSANGTRNGTGNGSNANAGSNNGTADGSDTKAGSVNGNNNGSNTKGSGNSNLKNVVAILVGVLGVGAILSGILQVTSPALKSIGINLPRF